MTFAYDTQIVMQSSFKARIPSFLDEIQRELRSTTMRSDHIILMGYSLPIDDVTYRAFFAARRRRGEKARCTIVNLDRHHPSWYGPAALKNFKNETVEAARDIFGKDNIRFYGGGVPNVFLDNDDRATQQKLEELLNWESLVSA